MLDGCSRRERREELDEETTDSYDPLLCKNFGSFVAFLAAMVRNLVNVRWHYISNGILWMTAWPKKIWSSLSASQPKSNSSFVNFRLIQGAGQMSALIMHLKLYAYHKSSGDMVISVELPGRVLSNKHARHPTRPICSSVQQVDNFTNNSTTTQRSRVEGRSR